MYGGHQQRIGGPLPGTTTIANFVAEYRDEADRPKAFGGRDEEQRRLDRWLQTARKPYLFLGAGPGRGKSALLAHWCAHLAGADGPDRLHIVFVPVSIRFEFNRQETVLRALASRLAAIHDEPAFGNSIDDWRDLVADLLQREPPRGTSILVVLDGLDEAAGWGPTPALLPKRPHDAVKLIASARLTAARPGPDEWLADLGLADADVLELGPLSVDGVGDVLSKMGPPLDAIAEDHMTVMRLHEITGGDPLVVGLYVDHLWARPPASTAVALDWLQNAEPGLAGYMQRWWTDQERLWDPAVQSSAGPVFDLLACALGPLERRDLLQLSERWHPLSSYELNAALRALDRFVVEPGDRCYGVAHPRLAAYRRSALERDGSLHTLERHLLDWVSDASSGVQDPPSRYVVFHRGEHLQRAGAEPEAMTGLLTTAWRTAWLRVTDDLAGWVDDIARFHAAAARADAATVAAGGRPTWAAQRAWATALRAEAAAPYPLVDGTSAAAFVRRGVWSERRALTQCAGIDDPWSRARYVTALAPVVSAEGIRSLAQIVRTLGDDDEFTAGQAMAAVAGRLGRDGDLDAAEALAADARSAFVRASGYVAILPAMPVDRQVEVLRDLSPHLDADFADLAPGIDGDIARRAFGDPPWRYLEDKLRGNVHWWQSTAAFEDLEFVTRAYALGSFAAWMTPSERVHHVGSCIDALEAYDRPHNVDKAVRELAPYLDVPGWHHVRSLARDRLAKDSEERLFTDVALLPSAPADTAASLLGELVGSLPALLARGGDDDIKEALAVLAQRGAAVDALEAVAAIPSNNWGKAGYLAAVAPYVPPSSIERALVVASECRPETRLVALPAVLARQADCGDTNAALAAASVSTSGDEVLAASVVLHVAAGRASFSEVVEPLESIAYRHLRVAAAGVAARLAPPRPADVTQVVLRLVEDEDPVLAMEAFALVGGELRGDDLADDDAVSTARFMAEQGVHPRKQQLMLDYFCRMARDRGVHDTLDQGLAWSTETFPLPFEWALAAVAGNPDTELVDLAAPPIGSPVLTAATLAHLPMAERPALLALAIECCRPAEVYSGRAALLLRALPDDLYDTAADSLLPDALLDGQPELGRIESWARSVADLCPALDARRLRRLAKSARQVRSSSRRRNLLATIAVRLGELGLIDESLDCVARLDPEWAATAYLQLAAVVPIDFLPSLLDKARAAIDPRHGQGAFAMAAFGRRVGDASAAVLSEMLDRWHTSAPAPDEVLVDLLVFGPALRAIGGTEAAGELLDRFGFVLP